MKKKIKKWTIRIAFTVLVSGITIILAVLNPGILYANKTEIGNYTVYHQQALDPDFKFHLLKARESVSESEIYDESFEIKVCLNDGSYYPLLMEKLRGRAYGWGAYNLAIYSGEANYEDNYIEINRYRWNLEQLLAHELTHCYQMNYFGFFNSNPMAGHATWKWEGYAEYVARKGVDNQDLETQITLYKESIAKDANAWDIEFADGTMAPRSYYKYWLLVQYSLDIKGMTYPQLLDANLNSDELFGEIEDWYSDQQPADL